MFVNYFHLMEYSKLFLLDSMAYENSIIFHIARKSACCEPCCPMHDRRFTHNENINKTPASLSLFIVLPHTHNKQTEREKPLLRKPFAAALRMQTKQYTENLPCELDVCIEMETASVSLL